MVFSFRHGKESLNIKDRYKMGFTVKRKGWHSCHPNRLLCGKSFGYSPVFLGYFIDLEGNLELLADGL